MVFPSNATRLLQLKFGKSENTFGKAHALLASPTVAGRVVFVLAGIRSAEAAAVSANLAKNCAILVI